jgi:hypothetical protein
MATVPKFSVDDEIDPLDYPGTTVSAPGLLVDASFVPLRPVSGRRFNQARLADESLEVAGRWRVLNHGLLLANAAPMDARFVVVAVGSNASPAVLHRKFSAASVSTAVPLSPCVVEGIDHGHSAHVSARGYVAAAPFAKPGVATAMTVSWLDREQVQALDETEPNYERVVLDGNHYPLRLENDERPDCYCIYQSRWGVLVGGDGEPLPFMTQKEIHGIIARDQAIANLILPGDPGSTVRLLSREPVRDQIREHWQAARLSRPSAIVTSGVTNETSYGQTESLAHPPGDNVFGCAATSDDLDRCGEACVVMRPEVALRLKLHVHCSVTPAFAPDRPACVARVVRAESPHPDQVLLDQTIRNALGVENREFVVINKATVRGHTLADIVLGRPRFVTCRIQPADLAIVEQDSCLLEPLAMALLGISDGDRVVIEGITPHGEHVTELCMRAHIAPEQVTGRREALSGGGFSSRFPASADTLGVYPDLTWIFLDAASRTALGLGAAKLGTVRVRASRPFQLAREVRELLLLLILAVVGLATVVHSKILLSSLLVVVALISAAVVRSRLRRRLSS